MLQEEGKIRLKDKGDFQKIFQAYFKPLCSFACQYLDPNDSQDLVQEAFISFWEKKENFEHINAIKAFLYTTTRNKCLNFLKHETVKSKHESSLIYELESEQYFNQHVIEEDVIGRLHREIAALPEASQNVMLLALQGLKVSEIANQLSVSENTVKTQKKIAYAKLKDKLGPILNAVLLCF
ncbi:MAG: RNA polymerase sigma-70 factor [Cyclobacteriaceae bacterium]